MTPEAWRAAGARHHYRGHPIFYRAEGEGPEVAVLLHGFPTASWDWHRVWPALLHRFRLVAPDLIGFGFSAKPPRYDYSVRDQASLVEDLLRELGLGEAHLLAHDYGDSVAQELLARAEERRARGEAGLRLHSVCFLNGGLFPEAHRARRVQKLLLTPLGPLLGRLMNERSFAQGFRAVFGPKTQPTPEEMRHYWSLLAGGGPRIAHRLIRYIPERREQRDRWVSAMQQTGTPLRLIDGALDPVSGAHMAQRYRELIPNPDVVVLPEIGHYPQMEDPEAVLREYLAFVPQAGALQSPP